MTTKFAATIFNGMTKNNPARKGDNPKRGRKRLAIGSTFVVGCGDGEVCLTFTRSDAKETIIRLSADDARGLVSALEVPIATAEKQAKALKAVADAQAALAAVQDGVPLVESKAAPMATKVKAPATSKAKAPASAKGKAAPKAKAKTPAKAKGKAAPKAKKN